MAKVKYIVRLEKSEQETLKAIVKKGKGGAFKIRRAQILLHSDNNGPGSSGSDIAKILHCRKSTVYDARKQFVEEGFEAAITRKKRETGPTPRLFDGEAEARLIALSRTEPPEGRARWTLQMLSDKVVELNIVPHCTANSVHEVLKKTRSNHT